MLLIDGQWVAGGPLAAFPRVFVVRVYSHHNNNSVVYYYSKNTRSIELLTKLQVHP